MLQFLRQRFARIRILFGALRAGLYGFVLVCAAWIFAAPPSESEIARLSLDPSKTASHEGLRIHRMAKIVSAINSDRLYTFVASRAGTGQTATQIRDNIEFAADGFGGFARNSNEPTDTGGADETQKAFVTSGGAKFVPARTN